MANTTLTQTGQQVQADLNLLDNNNATQGQVLTADGQGGADWQTPSSGMSNPMSAAGDIIVGGASGTPTRLAMGTAGQVLKVNAAGTGLEYGSGGSGGGTQLYKHFIAVNNYTAFISLIANGDTQFNSLSEIVDALTNTNAFGASYFYIVGQDSGHVNLFASQYTSNDITTYSLRYIDTGGTINSVSISSFNDDTVTPL